MKSEANITSQYENPGNKLLAKAREFFARGSAGYGILFKILREDVLVEEAVEQILGILSEKNPQNVLNTDKFLAVMAHRKAIDIVRIKNRRAQILTEHHKQQTASSPQYKPARPSVSREEIKSAIELVLENLKKTYPADAILLRERYLNGRTPANMVGVDFGWKPYEKSGTVRKALFDARKNFVKEYTRLRVLNKGMPELKVIKFIDDKH